MSVVESLNSICDIAISSKYHKHSIPSDIDRKIFSLLMRLMASNDEKFNLLNIKITPEVASMLGLFSERAASWAVRENNIDKVIKGLMALEIYAQRQDVRDVIVILSVLHDALIKCGGNPIEIFEKVSSFFPENRILADFLCRSEEDKSIESMGYKENNDPDGFLYVRLW